MAFSKRIQMIASLVNPSVNVIDIGCDHGLLDIYLTKYNNNSCLAADINEKAIQSAIRTINRYHLTIPTIVSNGLEKINVLENTTCIIAGMGTNTIINILKDKKAKLIDHYIIQTNNDYYHLRKFMVSKNYCIEKELTFIDKGIRYIVIKFKKETKRYSDLELILGPILIRNRDQESKSYFLELYYENNQILEKLPKKYIIKRLRIQKMNRTLKKLIKK